MRELADAERIRAFMRAIGRAADQPGRVYFTGGAQDLEDVRTMLERGVVDRDRIKVFFEAINPASFDVAVKTAVRQ